MKAIIWCICFSFIAAVFELHCVKIHFWFENPKESNWNGIECETTGWPVTAVVEMKRLAWVESAQLHRTNFRLVECVVA